MSPDVRTPTGRRDQVGAHQIAGEANTRKRTSPRELVQRAELCDLVIAYATGSRHPFAIALVDGETLFICPRCGRVDHNGGTARVVDQWRWACHSCRHNGTRWHLERMVLESADALEALFELTQVQT